MTHFSHTAYKNSLRSVEAQYLFDLIPPGRPPSAEELNVINDVESDHISDVRGRVSSTLLPSNSQSMEFKHVRKNMNEIDGARYVEYNPVRNYVKIRMDSSIEPEFWLEMELPLKQLENFILKQKAMYQLFDTSFTDIDLDNAAQEVSAEVYSKISSAFNILYNN